MCQDPIPQVPQTRVEVVYPDDYTVVKNERDSYKKLSEQLRADYESLKSQDAKVITVTEIKTIVEGKHIEYEVLPSEHIFKLNNDLPVAHFWTTDKYNFDTYDLSLTANIIVTEESTGVKLIARSSGSDEEYELPVNIVTYVEPEKASSIFRPQVMLGGSISYPYTGSEVNVSLPLLTGPEDKISWLAPMISISDNVKIGIAPVLYNIGKPLPLVDDLWVGPAYQSDLIGNYGSLVIGTKL